MALGREGGQRMTDAEFPAMLVGGYPAFRKRHKAVDTWNMHIRPNSISFSQYLPRTQISHVENSLFLITFL